MLISTLHNNILWHIPCTFAPSISFDLCNNHVDKYFYYYIHITIEETEVERDNLPRLKFLNQHKEQSQDLNPTC